MINVPKALFNKMASAIHNAVISAPAREIHLLIHEIATFIQSHEVEKENKIEGKLEPIEEESKNENK